MPAIFFREVTTRFNEAAMQSPHQFFTSTRNFNLTWLLIGAFVFFKFWLVSDQTLWALADNSHDDLLFVRLANYLAQFQWLGPYDNLTLAKGPFYPMWITFAFVAGVPLLLSQHLLYVVASLIAYCALRPLIEGWALRFALLTLLLFNPASFTFQLTRVLRDALYPGLTLLVAGSVIGLFARRQETTRSLAGWAAVCGLATAAFWLTREESVWILPLLVPLGVWTVAAAVFAKPRDWRKIAVVTLPLWLPILAVQVVSLTNLAYYGVYATVEFKTQEFKAAYGALTRVQPVVYKPQIPVPKETRQRIYVESKAFAELQPFFERAGFWTLRSVGLENHPSGADEIGGGWFMWALRDAMAATGYFSSGARASAFFLRLAKEINAACEAKRLDCLEERASLIPPWRTEYLFPITKQFTHGFAILVKFEWLLPHSAASEGSPANLSLFQDLTREKLSVLASNNQRKVYVNGWAVHASKALTASLIETKTQQVIAVARFNPSPDVYQHFLSMNQDINGANHARFEVQGDCIDSCILRISGNEGILADIPLKPGSTAWSTYPLWVHFDEVSTDTLPRQAQLAVLKQSLQKKIVMVYQIAGPFLAMITLAVISIWFIRSFRNRKPTVLGFIALCIAMALCARLLILVIIDVTSFPGIAIIYMSPLYPFSLLCYSLFIADFIQNSLCIKAQGHIQNDTTT